MSSDHPDTSNPPVKDEASTSLWLLGSISLAIAVVALAVVATNLLLLPVLAA